jgi:hypothetical protein
VRAARRRLAAPGQPNFAKPFQGNTRFFQAFSKEIPNFPLAILWEIKGLQAKKGNLAAFHIHAPLFVREPAFRRAGRAGGAERSDGSIARLSFFRKRNAAVTEEAGLGGRSEFRALAP